MHLKMSTAICFNLNQSKVLLSGYELKSSLCQRKMATFDGKVLVQIFDHRNYYNKIYSSCRDKRSKGPMQFDLDLVIVFLIGLSTEADNLDQRSACTFYAI